LVAFCRQKGFGPDEIALMTVVADPEVVHLSKKKYGEYLAEHQGINIPYERILSLFRNPDFQLCINLVIAQEMGPAIRAVKKTMIARACNPNDPQGVSAAKLVLQVEGALGRPGASPRGGGDPTVETVGQQFAKMVMDFHGKNDGSRQPLTKTRRFTVISEEVSQEGATPSPSEPRDPPIVVDSPSLFSPLVSPSPETPETEDGDDETLDGIIGGSGDTSSGDGDDEDP
jgi:hypothetical protein